MKDLFVAQIAASGLICLLMLFASGAKANFVGWQDDKHEHQWLTRESEHFIIHYQQAQQAQAVKSLNIAERVHADLTLFFSYRPEDKTRMVLVDDFDFSNGWATFFPFAQIRLFSSPPDSVNSLEVNDDWLHTLIRHEYVHILHMEMARGAPEELRDIFGRFPLLYPHAMTPSFMLEGLAVYLETDHDKAYGRLQGSYYDMLMRMEVASGELKSLGQVSTALREWPLGSNYLYGAYFFEFLAEQYGEEAIKHYLVWYSSELLPSVMQNHRMRRSTGNDFDDLWPKYQDWLLAKFQPQIEGIKTTDSGVEVAELQGPLNLSMVPVTSLKDSYYLIENNGEDISQLVRVGPDGKELLADTRNLISLDVNSQGQVIASRLIPHINGQAWADIYRLQDGDWHALTDKQRFRRIRWLNNDELIASRIVRGISELHLLNTDGDSQLIWSAENDETVVGDYSISPDASYLVAAVKRPLQGWNLERFDIVNKRWETITNTTGVENSPQVLADHSILYSADYNGVYNLMHLDAQYKTVTQLSSVLSGAFLPQKAGNKLYFQRYTPQGFETQVTDYAQLMKKPVKKQSLTSLQGQFNYPPAYDQKTHISQPKEYQPWRSLKPTWWFPSWVVTPEYSQFGFQTSGSDALSRHNYGFFFAYDFENLLADTNILYSYDNRYLLNFQREHEYVDLYNGDEPEYIVEQDRWTFARLNILNFFEDQLSLNAGILHERKTAVSRDDLLEPKCVNRGNFPHRTCEKTLTGLAWRYDSRRGFLNSPGFSDGHYMDLIMESHDVLDSDFSGNILQAQWQGVWDLPGRQALSARIMAGYESDQAEPFTIGGEYTLSDEILFGRDDIGLRGYEDSVQGGDSYQVNRLSYSRWLARIEDGWGIWPIGAGDLSASLFADSGAAWFDGNQVDYLTGIGVELKLEVVGFYRMLLPVTLGYAKGLDNELGKEQVYFGLSLPLQ